MASDGVLAELYTPAKILLGFNYAVWALHAAPNRSDKYYLLEMHLYKGLLNALKGGPAAKHFEEMKSREVDEGHGRQALRCLKASLTLSRYTSGRRRTRSWRGWRTRGPRAWRSWRTT